jgi:hypothetical protein
MQALIHAHTRQFSALGEINRHVDDPLGQSEQGNAGDQGNQKSMDAAVGRQPPLPTEGFSAARAFLTSHLVTLEPEIANTVAHRQQQEKIKGRGKVQKIVPGSPQPH